MNLSFPFRHLTGAILVLAVTAWIPACKREDEAGAAVGSRLNEAARHEDSPGKRLRQTATSGAGDLVRQLREQPAGSLDLEMLELAYAKGGIDQIFAALAGLKPPFDARTGDIMRALGTVLGSHGDVTPEMLGQLSALGSRGPEGGNCLHAYLQELCDQSAKKADQALADLKISKECRELLVDMLARRVGESDPVEGLRRLQNQPADLASGSSMVIIKGWLERDPGAALEALKALPQERVSRFLKNETFIESVMGANPKALAGLYAGLPYTEDSVDSIRRGLKHLVGKDDALAFGILTALPEGARRDQLMVETISEMVVNTEPETLAHIQEAAAGGEEQTVLRGIVRGIGQRDIGKALEFVREGPNADSADLNRELGEVVSTGSPDLATTLLADPSFVSLIGEQSVQSMVGKTTQTWAKRDRVAAQQWVEQLPPPEAPQGVQGLVEVWAKGDPVAAGQWLAALPAGPARDAGVQVIISQLQGTDPQAAEQWRGMLSNGSAR